MIEVEIIKKLKVEKFNFSHSMIARWQTGVVHFVPANTPRRCSFYFGARKKERSEKPQQRDIRVCEGIQGVWKCCMGIQCKWACTGCVRVQGFWAYRVCGYTECVGIQGKLN